MMKKLTAKIMYNDFVKAFSYLDSKKHQAEIDIAVLEGLRCIKKGEFKAGPKGGIIKVKL